MKCPICIDVVLEAKHSHGIEVDVCPRCNGAWLNHGELEKLAAQSVPRMAQFEPIDESSSSGETEAPIDDARQPGQKYGRPEWISDRRQQDHDDDDDHHDDDDDDDDKKRSKAKSFGEMLEDVFDDLFDLDDLFDFD